MSLHLKVSPRDYTIALPMDVIADLGNALTGIIDNFPVQCTMTMATLKTCIMPLTKRQIIEFHSGFALPWLFEDNTNAGRPVRMRAKSLAHLLPEVIIYQATVCNNPNQYRAWVLPALSSMNVSYSPMTIR